MPRPMVDTRHARQGVLEVNTLAIESRLPPPYGPLAPLIHRALTDSGYANVRFAIIKAPEMEIEGGPGQRTFKIKRGDRSGLKGPKIEIQTKDGFWVGEYALELTKTGIKGSIPPPETLLEKTSLGQRVKNLQAPVNALKASVSGFGQSRPGLQDPSRGYGPARPGIQDPSRGYGLARPGIQEAHGYGKPGPQFGESPQNLGQVPRVLGQGAPIFPQGPPATRPAVQGFRQARQAQQAPHGGRVGQGSRQAQRLQEVPGDRGHFLPGRGQPSSGFPPAPQNVGGSQQPFGQLTNSGRFYSSAAVAGVPPRPVPSKRLPPATGPRRAPIPKHAFTQNSNGQSQGGFNSSPRTPPSFNKEQGGRGGSGCCSGGDSSPGPRSGYDRLGGSEKENKRSEKERKRSEKERKRWEKEREKERKRAKKMMKEQIKNRRGDYGGSGGMNPEKSGFYDDNQGGSKWCCC